MNMSQHTKKRLTTIFISFVIVMVVGLFLVNVCGSRGNFVAGFGAGFAFFVGMALERISYPDSGKE